MNKNIISLQQDFRVRLIFMIIAIGGLIHFFYASSQVVAPKLVHDYYQPIRFSPHGKYVLFKNRDKDDFNLAIYDTSTGARKHIHKSSRSQISVHFSPDEEKLVFQIRNESNVFELFLFTFSDMTVRKLNAPGSLSGLPSIYWSPDSNELAYYEVRKNETILYLDNINDSERPKVLAREMEKESVLAWSPNGEELLVYSGIPGSEIVRLNKVGNILSRYDLSQVTKIKKIVWVKPREALLVSLPTQAEFFQLARLDLNDGNTETLISERANIEEPMVLQDRNSILYHASYRGVSEVKIYDINSGHRRTIANRSDGSTKVDIVGDHEHFLFGLLNNNIEQPKLVKIDIESGEKKLVYEDSLTKQPQVSHPKVVELEGGGKTFRAFLWEPETQIRQKSAILYVHGGPAVFIGPEWNSEIANLVNSGWAVMAPNYHGSSSEGEAFSNMTELSIPVAQVVSSIKYMRGYFPGEFRLYVMGESFGSRLALESLATVGSEIDGIILTSAIAGNFFDVPCGKLPPYIVAFHGAEDYLNSAPYVKGYLNKIIGENNFSFTVMPEEGHILSRESSHWAIRQAIIGAPIQQRLTPKCGIMQAQ